MHHSTLSDKIAALNWTHLRQATKIYKLFKSIILLTINSNQEGRIKEMEVVEMKLEPQEKSYARAVECCCFLTAGVEMVW